MTRVVFALERDAKTDPPEYGRWLVWTDQGEGYYNTKHRPDRAYRISPCWVTGLGDEMDPQPSVWYALRPTEGEPLTVEDIVWAIGAVDDVTRRHEEDGPSQASEEYARQGREVSARLRAALDALNASKDDT